MRKLLLFVIFLFFIPLCLAQTIELNNYNFKILYNKVLVENEIIFNKTQNINFTIDLPEDASGLSLYINNKLQNPVIRDSKISLIYSSVKKIKLDYITKEPLEKDTFLISLIMPFSTQVLKITLTLPEGSVLEKPLEDSISGSIYPKPDKATTDGKSLIFEWQRQNLKKGEEFAIFARYTSESRLRLLLWSLFLIVIVLVAFIFLKKTKTTVIVKKEEAIEKHLKEDEEQIVNILKKRSGQCEQGTLRVITGFSKATLSRLLKELEERKIIYKEKRGKKNLVFLKK